jgi:hypothetical protein
MTVAGAEPDDFINEAQPSQQRAREAPAASGGSSPSRAGADTVSNWFIGAEYIRPAATLRQAGDGGRTFARAVTHA